MDSVELCARLKLHLLKYERPIQRPRKNGSAGPDFARGQAGWSVAWFHCSARPGGATCGLERAHVAEQSSGSTSLGYSSAPSGVEDALEVLPHEIVREGVKVVLRARAIQRERDSILEELTADQLFIHLNPVEGKSNTKVE